MNTPTEKCCNECKKVKPTTEFYKNNRSRDKLQNHCKQCMKAKNRKYYRENREKLNAKQKRYYRENREKVMVYARKFSQKLRLKAMQIVSGLDVPICVNCGCDFLPILEINHNDGGGYNEQKTMPSSPFYRAIVKGIRTVDDLNILCKPCNALHYVKLLHGKDFPQQVVWK